PDAAAARRALHRRRRRAAVIAAAATARRADAEMVIAVRHLGANAVFHLLHVAAAAAAQHAQTRADFSAQKIIDGHTTALAHNVPQRAVNRRHGIVGIHAAAPIRRHPQFLPDLLHLIGV